MAKTNEGLVEYAKAQLGLPYWYATFGNIADADLYEYKRKKWAKYYNWAGTPYDNFKSQYGKRVHDCVGLIKGYLWSDTPTSKPKYDGDQDVSADGMRSRCIEKGDIKTMPDIPGVLVFMSGHVGVYIGNGEVIEARGHEYGVVKTKLKDRPWKWWGKCPWIEYDSGEKKLTVRAGTWNIRTGPSKNCPAVGIAHGGMTFVPSVCVDGWYYWEKLGGWISGKGITEK